MRHSSMCRHCWWSPSTMKSFHGRARCFVCACFRPGIATLRVIPGDGPQHNCLRLLVYLEALQSGDFFIFLFLGLLKTANND